MQKIYKILCFIFRRKLLIVGILVTIFFPDFLLAQSHISIHQQEYERYESKIKKKSKYPSNGEDIIPIDTSMENKLNRAVFGYLPDWEYNNGAYKNLKYELLSHIAAFAFSVSNNGDISIPSAWPWTDMINNAHSNGVKVIMVAVNFDSNGIHHIISDSAAKINFIESAKNQINTYKLDGINIDFEGLSRVDNSAAINNFMKDLTDSIHAAFQGSEVSFASPAVNWGGWDFTGLANSCDYLFVMGYDFFGSWSQTTGPVAPLTGGTINVTNTINVQYAQVVQVSPQKLILGVPYYGSYWTTATGNPGSKVIAFISSPYFSTSQPGSETYGLIWDNLYQTSWYKWKSASWNQVWFDNDSSLSLKYDFAVNKNLKGVGMWALGYDGVRQELWNLLSVKFGNGYIPAPDAPTNFYVESENDSSIMLNFSIPTGAVSFEIFISEDGINFDSLREVNNNNILIEGLKRDTPYFFKVKAKNNSGSSPETVILGGTTLNNQNVLVVNGYDKMPDSTASSSYLKEYAAPLIENNYSFSSSSNEAIFDSKLNLNTYDIVIWMLGNKSSKAFNQLEQEKIKSFLDNGGKLFVSGSNIGMTLGNIGTSSSTDISFYNNYLKASYISDAPKNDSNKFYSVKAVRNTFFEGLPLINFDDGSHGTFNAGKPDAVKGINGGTEIFAYTGISTDSGASGISYIGKFPSGNINGYLIYLAFPFETIYQDSSRVQLMSKILKFFKITVDVAEKNKISPEKFKLYQNFPNPFNPSTNISFTLPSKGNINLEIFNLLGQLIWIKNENNLSAGYHEILWNGINMHGLQAVSGIYIYRVIYSDNINRKSLANKMVLLK